MNTLKTTALLMVFGIAMTGCSATKNLLGKRDNGSLDYQSAQKLAPIKLPADQASADFIPLYPTPSAGQNTLNLVNDSGKQYQLPKPPKAVE